MDYNILISILIILFLLLIELILSSGLKDFFFTNIPEWIGIILTYRIVEYLIIKKEKERIEPLISNLHKKIGYAIYDISSGLGEIQTPENRAGSREMIDVVKEGRNLLIESLSEGKEYFNYDLIESITNIDIRLGLYIEFCEVHKEPVHYLDFALEILEKMKHTLRIIGQNYQYHIINKAIENIEYRQSQYKT